MTPAQQASYRRHHCCNQCGQTWAMRNTPAEQLPPSTQDAVFPGMKYDYCAGCGNLRMKKSK